MNDPISDRQIAANRENSKKSTGPKTTTGNAISRFNALKHGVFAEKTIIVGPPLAEDPGAFCAILKGLRAHYDPVGVHEDLLVQEIAVAKQKAVRLERYEAAGATERLSNAVATARKELTEECWGTMQRGIASGSALDPKERPLVTADELRKQIDLVDGLERGDPKDEDRPDFWSFVCMEKLGNGVEPSPPESVPEAFRGLMKEISPTELEDLKRRFRSQAERILEAMWMLRAKVVPHEAALERSLVPDEAEMNKIIRYSTYLTRHEERKVKMLEHVQEARLQKGGGGR
jgi:hypothetical protein